MQREGLFMTQGHGRKRDRLQKMSLLLTNGTVATIKSGNLRQER